MPPLFALDELTEAQREVNRTIRLMEKGWYAFDPPVEGLPLERKMTGVPHAGEPLTFAIGQYLRYYSKQEEHMFYAKGDDGEWYFLPLFLTRESDQTHLTERPEDAPSGT